MSAARCRALSVLFVALVVGQVAAALGSAMLSEGFFASRSGSRFRCRELLSSGRDDDLFMVLFVPAILSAIVRLAGLGHAPAWWEAALYVLVAGLPLVLVLGVADCGDLWGTLVQAREPYALAFASFALAAPAVLVLSVQAGTRGT